MTAVTCSLYGGFWKVLAAERWELEKCGSQVILMIFPPLSNDGCLTALGWHFRGQLQDDILKATFLGVFEVPENDAAR